MNDTSQAPTEDFCTTGSRQRYRARISAISPTHRRQSFNHNQHCFLAVSLVNSNFTKPKTHAMAKWISKHFRSCSVLVGDSIYRLTLEATSEMGSKAARAKSYNLGQKFIAENGATFQSFSDVTTFRFITCSQMEATTEYSRTYDRIRNFYASNPSFNRSVVSLADKFLKRGNKALGLSQTDFERRLAISIDYLLEEFAIISCMKKIDVPVMVYPGTFSTLDEVCEGLHPGISGDLGDIVIASLKLKGR